MNNFELLKQAATIVGVYLKSRYGGLINQTNTSGTHYETDDDKITDRMYHEALISSNIPIYSEERMTSELPNKYWLIDSIEGTTNYTHNNPFFATQGCLVDNNQIVCAVIYAPVLDQYFEAELGKGTYLNGKRVQIGNIAEVAKAIISPNKGTGKEYLAWWGDTVSKVSSKVRTVRLFGAVGLEMAYVSAGLLDIHINNGCHAYDDAPGSLLVKEAGGVVQNFSGKTWNLLDKSIIAGNKILVLNAQKLLR